MSREMRVNYNKDCFNTESLYTMRSLRAAKMRALRRKKQILRRKMMIAAAMMIVLLSIISLSGFVSVHSNKPLNCYYTTQEVFSGDTLTEIASEYSMYANKSLKKYIKEIMKLNNMNSTKIYAGQVLIIPYYTEEIK